MGKLSELLVALDNGQMDRARLYFITRRLKGGLKKTSKALDKFVYKCWAIATDIEVQKELFVTFKTKLAYISNEDKFLITDYTLVTDDAEKKILTYAKKEKISSFMHIVDDDLRNAANLSTVSNLKDIAKDIWAYIIEVNHGDTITCGLRKMSPSKVLTGEKGLLAIFGLNEQNLKLSKEQTVSFDKNIDVLYSGGIFYVVSKDNFEEIVGLHEEYREEARVVADKILNSPYITLNFNLDDEIENKNRYIRKLTKIRDEIDSLTPERIERMKDTARQFSQTLKSDIGKIILDTDKDLDVVIKLLDDYFLKSPQTDKKYGASVKKEMQ